MERLKGMAIFAKVVECGSFTGAATQLAMSVSSISQSVSKLEQALQIRLLNRSTRRISLTEAGRIYYQGCRKMLQEAQEVHEQLYAYNNTPSGTLRIGSSATMAQKVLAPICARMLAAYPGLAVNLVTGVPAPDLVADGLDLVIRAGELQDSSLFCRSLGAMPMVICAAKSYLHQHGTPHHPAELVNYSWLDFSGQPANDLTLITPEGHTLRPMPVGRFHTNDAQTLLSWLHAGAGIAYLPLMWVIDAVRRKQVEILFPHYQSTPRPVYALYAHKSPLPLKVRLCLEYLSDYFTQMAETFRDSRQAK
ncbi:HTH-type transcriptional activator AaeR [Edwardsiella tarda]|uniref:HTH-type transcriptional activator AaeR n=1 Tax=Edwardsiella tarda TaxID=636 RepID=UPI0002F5E8FD|nr:HTH-type transcriptional activator AaeR [Edwardsiella tarda]